jgi:hypothetical protein
MAMRALVVLGVAAMALTQAPPAQAQQNLYNIGTPISGPGQLTQSASSSDNLSVLESNVAFIDSALPRNTLRLRLDLGYDMPRPTRAEYFMAASGLPLAEPKINSYQDASAYVEFAPLSFFSMFLETPMRWLNPDINRNMVGYGDMNFGFKLCTWNAEEFLATLQLRLYEPTGRPGLGTEHWTIEPALLAVWRPYTNFEVEGEVRYWVPLNNSDIAGDVLRYGVGLSVGPASQGFWYKPVIEAVGWTVLGGKALVVSAPDSFVIENAAGQTIINGYLGMRLGMGNTLDFYAGYGRCFTGNTWTRDFVRVELRFFY